MRHGIWLLMITLVLPVAEVQARVLRVPGDFLYPQQAINASSPGDTVEVGRTRYWEQIDRESWEAIARRGVVVEDRYGELEMLEGEPKGRPATSMLDVETLSGSGRLGFQRPYRSSRNADSPLVPGPVLSRWSGQVTIDDPEGRGTFDVRIAIDHAGTPWAAWARDPNWGHPPGVPDTTFSIWASRWEGSGWGPEMPVSNVGDTLWDVRPTLAFDDADGGWCLWHQSPQSALWGTRISCSQWRDSAWTEESRVDDPPDTMLKGEPAVAVGGGEIWAVWGKSREPAWGYDVCASQWGGLEWSPAVGILGPEFAGLEGEIVVDSSGVPHVSYGGVAAANPTNGDIFYSTLRGDVWSVPAQVNLPDTSGDDDLDTDIAIDSSGTLYLVWAGNSASNRYHYDIFLSQNSGSGWSPELRVNQVDAYANYRPRIAVSGPDNIWIAWDKGFSFWDHQIRVVHFDGQAWGREEVISDSTLSYCSLCDGIALDREGKPWVVWDGGNLSTTWHVWSNRFRPLEAQRAKFGDGHLRQ